MGGTQADILRWTGASGDGDWTTAGNWATYAGSPTTTTPSDGEGVLFDHLSATGVTASLDQSATELSLMVVQPGFRFGLGTASAPLLIDVNDDNSAAVTPMCKIFGMGADIKLSGLFTNLQVGFQGANRFYLAGGTATNPVFFAGSSVVDADALISPASGSGETKMLGGNLTIRQHTGSGTSDIATFTQTGGTVNNYRTSNVLSVTGAQSVLRQLVDAAVDTRLDQLEGLVYLNSAGTIAQFNGYAGMATTRGGQYDFTITNQNLYLPTHTMDLKASPITVTESNAAVQYGFAGVAA